MEENRQGLLNPLQPVHELIQGGDPDLICLKYGISKTQLEKMLSAYQTSRREAVLADAFTASKTDRNAPCPCGSGKKYKKCCLPGHEEARKLIPKEQLQQMEERARLVKNLRRKSARALNLYFRRNTHVRGSMQENSSRLSRKTTDFMIFY